MGWLAGSMAGWQPGLDHPSTPWANNNDNNNKPPSTADYSILRGWRPVIPPTQLLLMLLLSLLRPPGLTRC